METLVEKVGSVQVVAIRGRLDLSATQVFEDLLLDLIRQGERKIVLDCAELRYVSSSGLGAFVAGGKELGSEGKLVFCALTQQVRHVFELVRFHSLFEVFGTREEAIQRLSQ